MKPWSCREDGAGQELIMLHGWGMEGRVFDGWLPFLRGLRILRPDLPGHGATPCGQGLMWEGLLQGLGDTLEGTDVRSPVLLGWSLGGLLALGLALGRPERFGALILVSSSPAFRRRPDWEGGIDAGTLADFADNLSRDPEGTRRRFLALQVMQDPAARQALAAARDWPLPDPRCLADGLALLRDVDLRQRVAGLPLPTLILHGGRDRIVPSAAARWLHASIPGSRLEIFPEAGHAPFLSHPAACAAALREFLRP